MLIIQSPLLIQTWISAGQGGLRSVAEAPSYHTQGFVINIGFTVQNEHLRLQVENKARSLPTAAPQHELVHWANTKFTLRNEKQGGG